MRRRKPTTSPLVSNNIIPRIGSNSRMAVDSVAVDQLRQDPSDPRTYSNRDIKKAEAIVRRFGIRAPIIVGADGRVLAGYLSVLAAKSLGITEMPCLSADDLSEHERKALSLALNRLNELGEFDRDKLGELFLDLELHLPDFNLDDIGFDQAEADLAIASYIQPQEVIDQPAPGPAVTQAGDIWALGNHRVGQGDATHETSVASVMQENKASMTLADSPYGCIVRGFVTSRDHREFLQASGEMDPAQLTIFFGAWCRNIMAHSLPGALVYLCIDWRSLHLLLTAAGEVFGPLLNLLVWAKDRAGMGSFYRSQHELILLYRVKGGKHRNNIELGRHGRDRSNLWQYPSAQTFSRNGPEGDLLAAHPTPKNLQMVVDAILDCTKRGDIVFDPFLGSGTTLVAADQVGRICYGLDLDPLYVDLAVRRWQKQAGLDAVNRTTGRTFDQTAREMADV